MIVKQETKEYLLGFSVHMLIGSINMLLMVYAEHCAKQYQQLGSNEFVTSIEEALNSEDEAYRP